MRILLALHAILLLLASTGFTIVTAFLGSSSLRWCYFMYSSRNGSGVTFESEYTVHEITTYIVSFIIGLLGFSIALKNRRRVVGTLGVLLSFIGLLSFAIEGSHWIVDHNRSWLAFSPAVMFALVVFAYVPKRSSDESTNPTNELSVGTRPA